MPAHPRPAGPAGMGREPAMLRSRPSTRSGAGAGRAAQAADDRIAQPREHADATVDGGRALQVYPADAATEEEMVELHPHAEDAERLPAPLARSLLGVGRPEARFAAEEA